MAMLLSLFDRGALRKEAETCRYRRTCRYRLVVNVMLVASMCLYRLISINRCISLLLQILAPVLEAATVNQQGVNTSSSYMCCKCS